MIGKHLFNVNALSLTVERFVMKKGGDQKPPVVAKAGSA